MPSPLRSPRLRRIIAAYTVNRLGTWFGFVALSVTVFDQTKSAPAVAALLLSGQVLPAFVAPVVIARVEASTRRGQLSWLYVLEGLLTTALALLILHFWLPGVLALVALDGSAALAANGLLRAQAASAARAAVQQPAASMSKPAADEEAQAAERAANAALNVAFSATFALGPAVAGVLVAAAGAPAALFIDAASFLICGTLLIDLQPYVEEAGERSVRARLQAARRHINDVPALRALLAIEAVALIFFEFAGPIEIVYAKSTLDAGDRGYGLLLAVWGVGVVIGSIIFARSARRTLGAMLSAGTLAIGLAYVGFAAAPSLAVACAAALLGGVGNGVQWASVVSAVQSLTPPHLLGRMMGALESLSAICPAVGLSLGGSLVAISSARGAFLVGGVGAGAAAAGFLWLAVGRLKSRPPTGGQTLAHADRQGRGGGAGEPARASAPRSINVD